MRPSVLLLAVLAPPKIFAVSMMRRANVSVLHLAPPSTSQSLFASQVVTLVVPSHAPSASSAPSAPLASLVPAPTNTLPATSTRRPPVPSPAPMKGVPVGASKFATSAISSYAPGATAFPGAPGLPDLSHFNPANYPALDVLPPLDSPQMLAWLAEIDLSNVPNIPRNLPGNSAANPLAVAGGGSSGSCWWTGTRCTRLSDVTACPSMMTWGLSYDDGPSPSTPKLLDYLAAQSIASSFFVVASRAIERPDILQAEHMALHQIAVHTHSHPALTTLSNEGIVAELAWSKQVIKDVLGVTPLYMRPPYGDIDDRVRYICAQMDLIPIIWTTTATQSFDTEDWQLGAGVAPSVVLSNFESIINGSTRLPSGFIVLEHDLDELSVELAVTSVLPLALTSTPPLTLEPIISCLGSSLSDAYAETLQGDNTTTIAANQVISSTFPSPTVTVGHLKAAAIAPTVLAQPISAGAGRAGLSGAIVLAALALLFV